MEIGKKKIADLKPAVYNPRVELTEGDPDYEKIKTSIEKFGHVQPVVWNKRTGNIVGGHQSIRVLTDMGYQEVDCVIVDMAAEDEKALNIALNKIAGRWDMEKLSKVMEELVDEGLAAFTGYEEREIERMMEDIINDIQELGEIDTDEYSEESFEHKCPRCGFLF